MTNELRWGFLGTGWIANVLASDLRASGRQVSAVGSRSIESAREFAAQHGVAAAFGSYEELCESPDIDAIYVATPNPFHLGHAKLALANGKHLLLEKPAALNSRQLAEIVEAARSAERFFMEAMWSRFMPAQLSVKAAIAAGEIGDVTMVIAEYSENKLPAENYERMWKRALGGGSLLDLGIYALAFIHNFLGAPQKLSAYASLSPEGVDQRLVSSLGFANGELAQLTTLMTGAGASQATIIGTRGRIEIGYPIYGQFDYRVFDLDRNELRRYSEPVVGSGRQLQLFAAEAAIANSQVEHPLMPWQTSIEIAASMDEIRRQVGVVYDADTVG